ncbi:MAG TPA: purine-nucleoside phosphorylase [Pyrinomonadaceae bacterium]|nr:purine-nucleoside phosphorylase [Pyrinomonadaceae bacterium]
MSYENAARAAEYIRSKFANDISTAVVLGSGLGAFGDSVEDAVSIPYEDIPGFARSTVVGHAGRLVIGKVNGVNVAVQQGRFHYYEGYDMEQVILPARTFGLLGIKNLIVTNAAGSMTSDMPPGSLMLITDHLNCMGVNPLRGPNDERFGPRFPDMTEVYDREFQRIADEEANAIAAERGLDADGDFLHRGIYCALSGPTYETPAEVRLYRSFGADAVGMSTVPEAVAAKHMGMKVLGFSCITNLAAGMVEGEIDHSHVMETGARTADVFGELLRRVIARIG